MHLFIGSSLDLKMEWKLCVSLVVERKSKGEKNTFYRWFRIFIMKLL